MMTQKPAAERRPRRLMACSAAALLIASLPLAAAQERSRPHESGDTGRTAREAGPAPSPSYHPPSAPSYQSSPGDSASSSSAPRTARPSEPGANEPHRQPPSRGSRGSSGYHYHDGYRYPYYYPGYGYGFWPGFFWWWWNDYPYYPYGYGYGDGYGRDYPYEYGRDAGALDLDVYPGRTEVYVDGQALGKVDAFDGWPRYLWLPKGTYDVAFYLDGYKTISRQITIYPGSVIDIDDRMEPGDSVRPEELVSKSHERRDERMRYERERSDRIDRGERGEPGDDDHDDWRDRVRHDRMRDRDRDDDGRDHDVTEEDRDSRKGRLLLEVEPEDASVYLDGRFVGTGSELALMRGGLPVTPGEHRLAVVRPGRKAEEREFEVKAGEDVELEVELESDSR